MQVAERFGEIYSNLKDISISVLYELAAPSTPEVIIEQVQSGEIAPTLEAIREAKEAHHYVNYNSTNNTIAFFDNIRYTSNESDRSNVRGK